MYGKYYFIIIFFIILFHPFGVEKLSYTRIYLFCSHFVSKLDN